MKKILIASVFSALILSQLNCSDNAASNNGNQTNANLTTATPLAETNTNTAKVEETPLPAFTDAPTALAEGIKLLDGNSTVKAIDALQQAIKLDPDLADAHFRLGIAYGLIEAEKEKEVETEVTPTPTPTKKGKNAELPKTDSEKSFANAIKAYKKILAKNSKDDVAHYNLGRAYNKLNEDEDAQKSLQQAIKLKPDDTEYQTEYGKILIKLAQYDEAVKALKKALEVDSSNLEAESLLEKAEAGKKRVDFGIKPKTPTQNNQPNAKPSKSSGTTKSTENDTPPPPPAPKADAPKVDKKGNP